MALQLITSAYAAVLGLYYCLLTYRVIRQRTSLRIVNGDGSSYVTKAFCEQLLASSKEGGPKPPSYAELNAKYLPLQQTIRSHGTFQARHPPAL